MLDKLKSQKKETLINSFLFIFFGVGIIGLGTPASRELFKGLMPFSLLLGMGLMFIAHDRWEVKQVLVLLVVAITGFGIEVAGVLTGDVFGQYSYGDSLGIKVWGTPPMIGLNWMMLIYCVYYMMQQTRLPAWGQSIAGSALMVVYDIIMEPVAIRLDMWSWGGGDIPLQNYIAWFVISLLLLALMHLTRMRYKNGVAAVLFFVQMIFFLILNIVKYYQS
ncbi:MAG: carotenoid biosynthesis protein [Bacteroidota bacterium]